MVKYYIFSMHVKYTFLFLYILCFFSSYRAIAQYPFSLFCFLRDLILLCMYYASHSSFILLYMVVSPLLSWSKRNKKLKMANIYGIMYFVLLFKKINHYFSKTNYFQAFTKWLPLNWGTTYMLSGLFLYIIFEIK